MARIQRKGLRNDRGNGWNIYREWPINFHYRKYDLLGAFANCQQRPLASLCLSAYPSLHMEQHVSPWADFITFDI